MENQKFDYQAFQVEIKQFILQEGKNTEVLHKLCEIGSLPSHYTPEANIFPINEFDELLQKLVFPLSAEEVLKLVNLSPPKDTGCFGVEWSIIHIVETISIEELEIVVKYANKNEVSCLVRERIENYKKTHKI